MSALSTLAEHGIHADKEGMHLLPPEQMQQSTQLQDECKEWEDKARQAKAREEALAQELSAALQAKADVEHDTKALEDKLFLLQQRYSTEVSRLPSLILPGPAFFLVHARANSPLCMLVSLAAFLSGKASVLHW